MSTIQFAFLLSLLAGLATTIGGFVSFFVRKDDFKFLSLALGFSAGVMVYISLAELLPESQNMLAHCNLPVSAELFSFGTFIVGIILAGLIDFFIPDHIEPGWLRSKITGKKKKPKDCTSVDCKSFELYRVGILTALVIAIHNFPEGLATFVSGMADKTLGISIAIAIAIHNIPEGISVAIPIYQSTGSKGKALWYSFLSGLSEPLGALIGFTFLSYILNDMSFGILFGFIAGIMVYIAFDELLPASRQYGGDGHISIVGVVLGMCVIGISLTMF